MKTEAGRVKMKKYISKWNASKKDVDEPPNADVFKNVVSAKTDINVLENSKTLNVMSAMMTLHLMCLIVVSRRSGLNMVQNTLKGLTFVQTVLDWNSLSMWRKVGVKKKSLVS